MGFELGKVDLNDLVIFGTLVRLEEALGGGSVRSVSDGAAAGSVEVLSHVGRVGEGRGCSAHFGTHVSNGGKTGTGLCGDARSKVLDDTTSTALKLS